MFANNVDTSRRAGDEFSGVAIKLGEFCEEVFPTLGLKGDTGGGVDGGEGGDVRNVGVHNLGFDNVSHGGRRFGIALKSCGEGG